MIGTAISLYMMCFAGMFFIYKDFQWYTQERHKFLSRKLPQNYTIIVDNIPPALRSKAALSQYVTSILGDTLLEINFVLHIKDLQKEVASREKIVSQLENAIAKAKVANKESDNVQLWAPTGAAVNRPVHKDKAGRKVDSILTYHKEVSELTKKVNDTINCLVREFVSREAKIKTAISRIHDGRNQIEEATWKMEDPQESQKVVSHTAMISFKSLWALTIASQVLHHHLPFNVQASRSPNPKSVFWKNVGLDFKKVQITNLLSGALTAMTCVLWTIPVAAVAGFTKVESLKQEIPALCTAGEKFELLDEFLGFLSPLVLIILTALLPMILKYYCQMEGHTSMDSLKVSLFSKLTLFMVIQVFFVSAISGSLFQEIKNVAADPAGKIVNILATSLPSQGVVFLNFVFVKHFLGSVIELLRIAPAVISWIHKTFAPNLTEKQVQSPAIACLEPG